MVEDILSKIIFELHEGPFIFFPRDINGSRNILNSKLILHILAKLMGIYHIEVSWWGLFCSTHSCQVMVSLVHLFTNSDRWITTLFILIHHFFIYQNRTLSFAMRRQEIGSPSQLRGSCRYRVIRRVSIWGLLCSPDAIPRPHCLSISGSTTSSHLLRGVIRYLSDIF